MTELVVVCTPTCNRRFSLEFSALCMKRQTYKNLHWIIVDNSTNEAEDWSPIQTMEGLPPVTYLRIPDKKPIGHLRNVCLDEAKKLSPGYVAFWDDDDYYVPQRIETSVKALENDPSALIVGCAILPVFLCKENALIETGPYGANHSTAATYLFRRYVAETRRFKDTDARAEETAFTRDWSLRMVMIPPRDTMLVVGHGRNTVDKSQMLRNPANFAARVIDTSNAKQIVRVRWFSLDAELWECFCKTFLHA